MRRWLHRDRQRVSAAGLRGRHRRRPALIVAVVGIIALVTACSGPGDAPSSAAGGSPTGFPVTVTNCGRTLTFNAPPQRVAILSPIIARDLIALGLADRIVGQSGTDYFAPPPETTQVPVLSANNATSTEVLLGARPDLVISDLAYRLDPNQGGASLSKLQRAGVKAYVATAGCSPTSIGGAVTDEFTDVENLGKIFGVEPQARALVTRLKGELADVEGRVAGQPKVTVFEGTLYGDKFYPVAGIGLDALGRAGGSSIFPQVENANASVSKEEITARNPQAIIAQISYPGSFDRQKEIAALRSTFPTTAAVRDNRLYFVNYVPTAEPGSATDTVNAVRELATFVHPTAFAR